MGHLFGPIPFLLYTLPHSSYSMRRTENMHVGREKRCEGETAGCSMCGQLSHLTNAHTHPFSAPHDQPPRAATHATASSMPDRATALPPTAPTIQAPPTTYDYRITLLIRVSTSLSLHEYCSVVDVLCILFRVAGCPPLYAPHV
jgi:hypothetical protein